MLKAWASLTQQEFMNLGPVVDVFRRLGWVVEKVPSSSHGSPKTTGVYLLVHFVTGQVYVGSHGNLYHRPYQHHSLLVRGKHWNERFQEAFGIDNQILPMFIVTKDREEAYDLEQRLLDQFLPTGLLFNTAKNARLAMKDLEVSEETRARLGHAARGRQQSPEWVEKRVASQRGVPLKADRIEKIRQKALERGVSPNLTQAAALVNSRKVMVDGVVYDSIVQTAVNFEIGPTSVTKRIASKNPLFAGWSYFTPADNPSNND